MCLFTAFTMMHIIYPSGCFLVLAALSNALTINMGIVFMYGPELGSINSIYGYERCASAISLALDDYRERTGRLTEHTFRPIITHGACRKTTIFRRVFSMYMWDRPDVLFGLPCSSDLIPLGLYLSNWKLPVFPHGAASDVLADKSKYTSLVRIEASGEKIGNAFKLMFLNYGWQRAAMVTAPADRDCLLQSGGIHTALLSAGVTITEWIKAPYGTDEFIFEQYIDQVRERARVIIVCLDSTESTETLRFLRIAHRKGMRAPDYVLLNYGIHVESPALKPWSLDPNVNEELEKEWKKILIETNYKQVRIAGLKGQRFEDFYDQIPIRFTQPPWNFNLSLERGWRGSNKGVDAYDAALTYFTVLDEVLTEGGDYRDGDLLRQKVENRIIHGLRGKILYDEKADREPDYWVLDLQPGWNQYKEVLTIIAAEEEGKRFQPIDNQSVSWGTVGNLPPPDTPLCGFQNELCVDDTTDYLMLTMVLAASGVILLAIIAFSFVLYRRKKAEEALQQTVWKVAFTEIRIRKARAGSIASMSQKSLRSEKSDGSAEEGWCVREMFTEVGTYRGILVAILRVHKASVHLTIADMMELKVMKDMSHNNLAMFVGACTEPPNICYVMGYYTKGSLQDIIDNDIISLEWMFKSSLLSDLVNGMAYLHKSELHSHGSLKSTCCLVDSRWTLKVSSYGLHAYRTGQDANGIGEYEKYRKLLWTAPELLRMPKIDWPRYGTQAGDVYSFAVIALQVIYRASPYFMEQESPKSFISKVARGDPNPYRPQLPKVEDDTPPDAVKLVQECWVEDPTARPSFDNVIKMITIINKGQEVDIMDSLIEKLESYANNLEDIVNQRTSELMVEKKRTDALLESMLPPSVVEELKHGRKVDAELFEAVTIFFSDIVGFTALSLESSPIDVVNLLNDLYNLFDGIIRLHDVYKVETIGDSYMVVSGLPGRNGDNHVGEIANLALDLMSAALCFKISHRPGLQLKLRIGFHTGPCAAGVVGLSMPRYCLFGDTVNMASRMETNGKALMIHMSRYAFAAVKGLGGYEIKPRGEMQIKGKGLQMTYWLLGKDGFNKPLPPFDK